jgi:hypothetical protein
MALIRMAILLSGTSRTATRRGTAACLADTRYTAGALIPTGMSITRGKNITKIIGAAVSFMAADSVAEGFMGLAAAGFTDFGAEVSTAADSTAADISCGVLAHVASFRLWLSHCGRCESIRARAATILQAEPWRFVGPNSAVPRNDDGPARRKPGRHYSSYYFSESRLEL